MTMRLINLTPHSITILPKVGEPIVIEPSGQVARVEMKEFPAPAFPLAHTEVECVVTRLGKVEGLPPEAPDTCYIVSSLVAEAAFDRSDLYIPHAVVRDEKGVIVGCQKLALRGIR